MGAIEIIGASRLKAKLKRIAHDEKTIMTAVGDTAKVLTGRAKSLAPVDTGELRRGIKYTAPVKDGDNYTAEVQSTAPHAQFIEFGTGVKGIASSHPAKEELGITYTQGWGGISAVPYMYPASKLTERDMGRIIANAIRKTVRNG